MPCETRCNHLLEAEQGFAQTHGSVRVGVLFPNGYGSAMGSLGYVWLWQRLSVKGITSTQRYIGAPPGFVPSGTPVSLEAQRPLQDCDLVAASISWELDIITLIRMLLAAGIAPLASVRTQYDPLIIAGGPLTRSNPDLLTQFCDLVVVGDGERAVQRLVETLAPEVSRQELLRALTLLPEVAWHNRPQASPRHSPDQVLPVTSPGWTPNSAFGAVTLTEVSRGCPKKCAFCIGAAPNSPLRMAPADKVIATIPEHSPGIGIIGAAAGFYPGMKQLLEWAAANGKTAGVSSLRADRLDNETVSLLKQTGTTVLTVAADGASQRIRDAIGKDVTAEHLLHAAGLAKQSGMNALKLYMMIGYPDETDSDIEELAALANQLNNIIPVVLSIAILVPKKGTPLASAPFGSRKRVSRHIKLLRKQLSGGVRVPQVSPREAQIQHLLSHATPDDAHSLIAIATAGNHYTHWKEAFPDRLAT